MPLVYILWVDVRFVVAIVVVDDVDADDVVVAAAIFLFHFVNMERNRRQSMETMETMERKN